MLRKIRITLATLMFVGLTWLFVDFTGTASGLLGWMARIQFLEAVMCGSIAITAVLLVLTLIFGRAYCSVICPLGVMQDIIARMSRKANRKKRYTFSPAKRVLRYAVLALYVAALVGGIGIVVQLLAPYSTFGRIATNIMQPIYMYVNNMFAWLAGRMDSYAFYQSDLWLRSAASLGLSIVMLLVIGVLAWRNGRTWCNTICPVGTFLSFFSRFSLFKVRFNAEKCRNCTLCTSGCKASCIDYKTHTVDSSRCVVCGNCVSNCKFGALKYEMGALTLRRTAGNGSSVDSNGAKGESAKGGNGAKGESAKGGNEANGGGADGRKEDGVNGGRRAFLTTGAMLAGVALAQEKKNVHGGLAELIDKEAPKRHTQITPPGSVSARNMERRCTGCQLCISECPNGVLRPSTDLLHFMQPVMSYERGYCRPECNRCSRVCPAGAIKPFSLEQKASTQIGHAVWVKKNCVILTDGVECGNCARHCPVQAIEMVPLNPDDDESPYVPAVDETRCIGCGACENLCPARPFSAIYVEGHEVHKEM